MSGWKSTMLNHAIVLRLGFPATFAPNRHIGIGNSGCSLAILLIMWNNPTMICVVYEKCAGCYLRLNSSSNMRIRSD